MYDPFFAEDQGNKSSESFLSLVPACTCIQQREVSYGTRSPQGDEREP